jgi:hypothetical protein
MTPARTKNRGPNPGPGLPAPQVDQILAAYERAKKMGKYSTAELAAVVAQAMRVPVEQVREAVEVGL